MNAFHEEISGGLLQDDAARAEAHGANDVAIVFRGGQNDDARGSVSKLTSSRTPSRLYPACADRGEEYRLELGEELDALRAVLASPTM